MSKSASVWPFPVASLPFEHRLGDDVGALRAHQERLYAIGDLAGSAQPGRRDRGGVDLEIGICVQNALQRLAEAARVRTRVGDLVVLAAMLQRSLACEHLAHDLDVFFRAGERLAVRHAMPTLDHLRPRRADAEEEAVVRHRLQRRRRHGRAGRGAGRHLHDAGAGFDLVGAGQHPGDRRDGIRAVGLARPHRRVAQPLGLQHQVHARAAGLSRISKQ